MFRPRAPELRGRRWLNADGPGSTGAGGPTVAGLRGRVVVLHFSTAGCVNCVHAEAELDALVPACPGVVVLGVHSPKFPHEATPAALDAAVGRAGTTHPVLDDADRTTWDAYAVGAWPTLVVLDPRGRVAGTFVGEGHLAALEALVADLLEGASPVPTPVGGGGGEGEGGQVDQAGGAGASGRWRHERGRAGPADPAQAEGLRFPAAALGLPDGRLLVSDAGHRRLVVVGGADAVGAVGRGAGDVTVLGSGPWVSPAGMALLPPGVAALVGWDVAVADPGAHLVRGVRLADGATVTVAGTGEPLRPDTPAGLRGGPALGARLSSPAGLAWCAGRLVVAMSGVHQLWTLEVAPDPADGVLRVVAGSGAEGLLDGVGAAAMLAQPSAVVAAPRGPAGSSAPVGPAGCAGPGGSDGVWFVDAESSSLRRADPPPTGDGPWAVGTLVGTGTYAYGHVDGDAAAALMQHPLGLAVDGDGAVLVADTYDGAVRRVDVGRGVVTTLADGLAEPADVVVVPGGVVVVESAAHRLTPLATAPGHVLAPGPSRVVVDLVVPPGAHLDDTTGPATLVEVAALPEGLLAGPVAGGAGGGDDAAGGREPGAPAVARLVADVVLAPGAGGVLVVRARALVCDDDRPGAACRAHERTWRVPVVVDGEPGGARGISLAWSPVPSAPRRPSAPPPPPDRPPARLRPPG